MKIALWGSLIVAAMIASGFGGYPPPGKPPDVFGREKYMSGHTSIAPSCRFKPKGMGKSCGSSGGVQIMGNASTEP